MSKDESPTVCIMSTMRDRVMADRIGELLEAQGYILRGTSDPANALAVVVLLSNAALADSEWLRQVDGLVGKRIVPVAVDADIVHDMAPRPIAELNWIVWTAQSPEAGVGLLVRAVNTDLGRYRRQQGLESLALAWNNHGRRVEDLLPDLRSARSALAERSSPDQDLRQEYAPIVTMFIDQSLRSARASRRRRWMR